MHVLTDSLFFTPSDGVNTMPTDDNHEDLTNWLGFSTFTELEGLD